jgi:hypothetical protein
LTTPLRHSFERGRFKGWATLGFGWICAQSLLTLIPIAPNFWGVSALAVGGGAFVVVALTGVARLVARGPGLVVAAEGLTLGRLSLAWDELRHWRLAERPLRLEFVLDAAASRRLPAAHRLTLGALRPQVVRIAPGDLRATLTEVGNAVRQVRPDLEDRQ